MALACASARDRAPCVLFFFRARDKILIKIVAKMTAPCQVNANIENGTINYRDFDRRQEIVDILFKNICLYRRGVW